MMTVVSYIQRHFGALACVLALLGGLMPTHQWSVGLVAWSACVLLVIAAVAIGTWLPSAQSSKR